MKKLLFITGGVHYPTTSGFSLRVYNLLKIYSQYFQVVLLANSFKTNDKRSMEEHLGKFLLDCTLLDSSDHKPKNLIISIKDMYKPNSVRMAYNSEFPKALDAIMQKYGEFDFIHVERLMMTEFVKKKLIHHDRKKQKFILDLDDWESQMRFEEHCKTPEPNYIKRIRRRVEPMRLLSYEKKYLNLYDYVYLCSESDKNNIASKLKLDNVVVVPNGYAVEDVGSNVLHIERAEKILLYIGALSYMPNVKAIEYFIENIFPLVLKRSPDVMLWIAGSGAPESMDKLNNHPSIRYFGFYEDLSELYSHASVMIVPILSGGGTRIKILEAASYGVPVVSTTAGCAGLDFENEKEILIRDEPVQFSSACCELMENASKNKEIAIAANNAVQDKYSWSIIGNRIKQYLF